MFRFSPRRLAEMAAGIAALALVMFVVDLQGQAPKGPAVFVAALDRLGEPVTDLDASQVTLLVDGTKCSGVKLEPIDWPTKLTVIIDNSVAMRADLPSLQQALRAFLAEIPEGMEVSIYVLSPQPRPLLTATTDRQKIGKAPDLLAPDAGVSKFIDGLAEAVGRVVRDKGNFFYTIVAFTTNGTEGSNGNIDNTWEQTQSQIPRKPLTLHTIMYSLTGQTALRTSGIQLSIGRSIADGTGGRFENVGAATRLVSLFQEYGKQIARSQQIQRHQYRATCEGSTAKNPAMSISTSNQRVSDLVMTRDGRVP